MMVPFDGTTTTQQASQSRGLGPPMGPGHQGGPSPMMPHQHHQQSMNAFQHPGMHRQPSNGMGAPNFSVPQSPSTRQTSFGMTGGHYQQSSHHSMHSPAHQQQQHQNSQHHGMHHGQMHPSAQHQNHPQHMGMGSGPVQNQSMNSGNMHQSDNRQRQFMPSMGMNGNWQSDKDMPHRREMIQHIVKMLKKDKTSTQEWLNKLPQMAKQLEVSLYKHARSFEDYVDMSTLKQRLQMIAMEVSRKAKNQGDRSSSSSNSDRQRSGDRNQVFQNGMHPPQHQDMMRTGSHGGNQSPFLNVNQSSSHQMMQQQQQQQQHISGRQSVKMDDINPMLGGSSGGGNDMMSQSSSNAFMGGSRSGMGDVSGNRSSSSNQSSSISHRNDREWKIRIRHKQQRLLLLHHSAKCPRNGNCDVTPHCADMKRLWRHMEGCKDNNCQVAHCFSSRAILSHYRKCKDQQCPACGPVRETVRKSQKGSSSSSRNRDSASRQGSQMPNIGMGNMGIVNNQPNQPRAVSGHGDTIAPNATNNFASGGMASSFQQQMQHNSSSSSRSSSMPPPNTGASPLNNISFQMQSSNPGFRGNQQQNSVSSSPPNAQQQMISQMMSNQQKTGSMMVSSNRGSNGDVTPSSSSSSNRGPSKNNSSGTGGGSGQRRNTNEWQKVRHKQQRLLLLRHASKCQYEAGTCPVTPHCGNMKKLWEHIARCKNQDCTVQHCMSSRYVLSHFRRCKDPRCPACGPVRETIRNSHAKEKNRQQNLGGSSVPSFDVPATRSVSNEVVSSSSREVVSSNGTQDHSLAPRAKKSKHEHMRQVQSSSPVPGRTGSSGVAGAICLPVADPSKSMPSRETLVQSKAGKSGSKQEDHSLLNSFTTTEIETHLASLHRAVQLPPAKLKSKCLEVLKGLQNHNHGWVFNNPVDPVELGLPDYFDVIKKPMDLGTINKKLDSGLYHSIEEFSVDVRLTFDNAMRYNEKESVVHGMATELKDKFLSDHKKLLMQLEAEDKEARNNDRACTLCGSEKLLFEPPVFFCNGMNCASKRIRRNSHFYIGGNNQYFWCNQCYNELDGSIPIELVDMTIMKNDLKKKKNDEQHEESWVQCDECESWIHQICGLFNTRQNKEHHSKYFCPKCLLQKRKTGLQATTRPPSASDLPRTRLSECLEKHVHRKVAERKHMLIKEKVETEKISYDEAESQLACGGPIIIRQVTATDRKLEVRELMKKRYAHKNYPDEFPFRCKCIVVFQRMDGVDVILFALYVYEHGDDNPFPNKRAVYVSYLDSVHFMRPRKLRTFVYHELLIAYLDYARRKGFATAHIWACPPLKGDDYIFYAKPEDQKTPRDARLRQWYIDMLVECQKRSICGKLTNMYDLYFADESLDATSVPYFEGDYFPGEAENIIKEILEGGGKKGSSGGKKNKKKTSKSKNRGGRMDDDELMASGLLDGPKRLEDGGRDEVMVKLGETIHPMKDSFIVAFLNWSGAKREDLAVPESILQYRREHPGESADAQNRKRDHRGEPKDQDGRPIKVIDDDEEDMDCEFLNNRQAFLNLCRGNHYQFDELRRAKHTSMMVLWHLHNRDAPKFVQQCASCSREILTGTRYHCSTCPDYDLCEECHRNPKTNRGACNHTLQAVAVEPENNQDGQGAGANGLTEAQRRERQRNLQLHIQLIEHASRCESCSSSNCAKMKTYLQHGRSCKLKASGGCKICKRIWTLLRIHAQKCKDTVCPIPQCMAIRERIRQLAKQQQAMDDRRRQEMNRAYRMNAAQHG